MGSQASPATVTVDAEGQVLIPQEMRSFLGLRPGSTMTLRVEGERIILQSVEKLLAELQQQFADGPSLEDELYKERRADKQ